VIGKVMRGNDVGGLLRYLFGPGRANEHTDPHLVASWDDQPEALQPTLSDRARHDVQPLARLLHQPVAAAVRAPERPVWHCAVRVAPTDRRPTDAEWGEVARDIVARTGLAPLDDDVACRWVAVRHADDHIHLVVTLARQDGAPARVSNDFFRVGEACQAAERRLHLTGTANRDRTAARRPTRAETEKATRAGRPEAARATLTREVRTAAAGAATADEFLARLTDAGLLVRPRWSERDPDVITGYAVSLPDDRTPQGSSIWFGGGKLAADLTLPKLADRWRTGDSAHRTGDAAAWPNRLTGLDRAKAWRDATTLASTAASDVARLAVTDPDAASDIAHATGRLLSATARVTEGRRGGPLTVAADTYDRAARDLHARPPRGLPIGDAVRAAARLVALVGRAGRDETTQVIALVANLAALADTVADLRYAQQRVAQAEAARTSALQLRSVAARATATSVANASRRVSGVVHSPLLRVPVHRSAPEPTAPDSTRRRVVP
jgi:hypothetical protein